ncbi:MAG: glycosyltransferase [Rhodospirillales bacterium]|nr:glycosyltransferase [Rhodospirillales bacterium]
MIKTDDKTTKPRVLFLLPALTAGGAERVLITLANRIDRQQFSPAFLTVSNEGPMRDIIAPDTPFHTLGKKRVSRGLFALYSKLRELRPDIVVSTMAHMNFGVLLLKPFFPNTHFIVREAITPSFFFQTSPLRRMLIRWAYRILYPWADLIVSPARIIIDEFKTLLGMSGENHVLLRNPVDTAGLRQNENTLPPVTEERKKTVHFVAAGRLHRQKGFDRLIIAAAELKMPYEWHLTILGEGEERENLEKLIAEQKLENRISLPGLIAAPWPSYAAADCFLLPSRFEGLPNVALEALCCGTPVIATDTAGGIQEIAASAPPHAVTIVDDMDHFIDAMSHIHPAPTQKFRASLLPVDFETDTVVKKFEDLLATVLSSR